MPRRIVRADGAALRAWRQSHGWDAPEMARRLRAAGRETGQPAAAYEGLVRMVYGWERGDHKLTERYALLYARALGVAADVLASSPPRSSDGEDSASGSGEVRPMPSERMQGPLRAPEPLIIDEDFKGGDPGRAVSSGSDDVVDVLKRIQRVYKSTVHPDIVRHLQDNVRTTVAQYENLEHASLIPALRKQRAWIESLIDECGHPAQRKQLFEVAGVTSGVLGYVTIGGGNFPLARAYCLEAFQLAEFAGDLNLQAWSRGLQSFCEYYAGRYDEAARLANDGLGYARSGPQSARLKINGAARALAKLGDVRGVDRAVDEAHELAQLNEAPSGLPSSISLGCYSVAQVDSNSATAYVSLGIPEKAQHYIGRALPEISGSDSPWSRSLVLIDLATAHVRTKEADLDYATTLIRDALAISAGRPIISVQQRAVEFARDAIDRWGDVKRARVILDAIDVADK